MAERATSGRGRGLYRRALFAFLLMSVIPILAVVYAAVGFTPGDGPARLSKGQVAVAGCALGLAVLGLVVLLTLIRSLCRLVGDLHAVAAGLPPEACGDYEDEEVREAAQSLRAITSRLVETSRQLRQRSEQLERSYGELVRLQREIRAAHEVRNAFVTRASHEMRTPLAKICGYAEMLLEEAPPPAHEGLTVIRDSSRKLSRLVERLLEVANVESGVLPTALSEQDLGALARSAADSVAEEAAARNVVVRFERHDEDLTVYADAQRLMTALRQAIGNAVAASPRGGEVVIALKRDGECAVLTVRDHGPGIPPELICALSEGVPDRVRWERAPSLGLGLTLVRSIVDKHGGEVYVEAAAGGGTLLSIALPTSEQDARLLAVLRERLNAAQREKRSVTLALVDASSAGEALPQLCVALGEVLRDSDHVAPVSGGRIALVCDMGPEGADAVRVRLADALAGALRAAAGYEGTPPVAFASYPADGTDTLALLRAATLRLPERTPAAGSEEVVQAEA